VSLEERNRLREAVTTGLEGGNAAGVVGLNDVAATLDALDEAIKLVWWGRMFAPFHSPDCKKLSKRADRECTRDEPVCAHGNFKKTFQEFLDVHEGAK